jgi:cysteine desulfurase/selenocysteine lyase
MWTNGNQILYGKEEWFNKLPPYQGGGEMIKVSFEKQLMLNLINLKQRHPNIAGELFRNRY